MAEFAPTSPAFEQGHPIPRKHTCEGEDVTLLSSHARAPKSSGRSASRSTAT